MLLCHDHTGHTGIALQISLSPLLLSPLFRLQLAKRSVGISEGEGEKMQNSLNYNQSVPSDFSLGGAESIG